MHGQRVRLSAAISELPMQSYRTFKEDKAMNNIPKIKLGLVAVSRDCFPESLSVNRRKALVEAYKAKYDVADIYECPICIVESEIHMVQALEDIKKEGCNALDRKSVV